MVAAATHRRLPNGTRSRTTYASVAKEIRTSIDRWAKLSSIRKSRDRRQLARAPRHSTPGGRKRILVEEAAMRFVQLFALAIVALCSGGAAAATAYASNEGSGTVSVIDTATDRVTATITTGGKPRGIALSLDGTKLYLSDQEANAL